MKALLLLALALFPLAACSSPKEERSTPPPATVEFDSTGIVVDTSPE